MRAWDQSGEKGIIKRYPIILMMSSVSESRGPAMMTLRCAHLTADVINAEQMAHFRSY